MKTIKILLLSLSIISCSADDHTHDNFNTFFGFYKIVSFKSDIAVDLNNDNKTSSELMDEIDSFGLNDLEIRPNENQLSKGEIISFFFPKTWITFQYQNNPEGYAEFVDYGFATTYKLNSTFFELKQKNYTEHSLIDNMESDKRVVLKSNLYIIDNSQLKLIIGKKFYDFSRNDWITLDIEIIYEKN